MIDYEDNVVITPFMKMGISLFGNEFKGGGMLSNLYFPGGLFVINHYVDKVEEGDENEIEDPAKIEVIENFDVFIDLVHVPDKKLNKTNKTKKTKTKMKNHLQKN